MRLGQAALLLRFRKHGCWNEDLAGMRLQQGMCHRQVSSLEQSMSYKHHGEQAWGWNGNDQVNKKKGEGK